MLPSLPSLPLTIFSFSLLFLLFLLGHFEEAPSTEYTKHREPGCDSWATHHHHRGTEEDIPFAFPENRVILFGLVSGFKEV